MEIHFLVDKTRSMHLHPILQCLSLVATGSLPSKHRPLNFLQDLADVCPVEPFGEKVQGVELLNIKSWSKA